MRIVRELRAATADAFENEVRSAGEPAILRGLAADWPIVAAARKSDGACCSYLMDIAANEPVAVAALPAGAGGRLHYDDAVSGPNFARRQTPLREFLDLCVAGGSAETLAAQGLEADRFFPTFRRENRMPFAPDAAAPRLWIGGRVIVAAHADPAENIAIVAAGRRRFTLFPPEQVGNLYIGPFHITPGGTPVSMAHVTAPDFERFPRFRNALEAAFVAELEPGDALYIPYYWFHHVESLGSFNVLVNYWWDAARGDIGSPWDVLMHGMMTLRNLPADQRRAWRALFDQYVFLANGDPAGHLPESAHGILSATRPQDVEMMRRALIEKRMGADHRRK